MPPRERIELPPVGTKAAERISAALCVYHTAIADHFGVDAQALHAMVRTDPGYAAHRDIFRVVYAMLVDRRVTAHELCTAVDRLCPWVFLSDADRHRAAQGKRLVRETLLNGFRDEPDFMHS